MMNNFIKLTTLDDATIFVNPIMISAMEQKNYIKTFTEILVFQKIYKVKESPEEIIKKTQTIITHDIQKP